MVGVADQNGKTYECLYGTYNKEDGFKFNDSVVPIVDEFGWREIVNMLFHENLWKLKKDPVKQMTLEEVEKELGYKVEIVKDKKDEKKEDESDSLRELFSDLFGFDILAK